MLLGLAAAAVMLPLATVLGTGGLWAMPGGDPAQALTGHLAYQASGWRWPLLLADHLAWPVGRSIAMTDSNPLVSVPAKIAAGLAGHPVNLLGVWLAACWTLQPVAALFALRSFGPARSAAHTWIGAVGACALGLLCPAWLARCPHINLFGHFLLLLALGLTVRMVRRPPGGWWTAGAVLTTAILVHPYLFVFSAILFAAPVVLAALSGGQALWRAAAGYAGACVGPVLAHAVLSGTFGGRASGYGFYSMNLLSPFVPQLSGLFGAGLPALDGTGGQHFEGFNYQGAGVLLVVLAAGVSVWRRGLGDRRAVLAVAVPLAVLTALALSPHVYAGRWLVLRLPMWPWDRLAGAVQSSGRAFWVVGYAVWIGAVAVLAARLRAAALLGLLTLAVVLQAIDTAPEQAHAAAFFAGRQDQGPPAFAVPDGAALLRVVPACDPDTGVADKLRLAAARRGLLLADMRMSRDPAGFDCETALADGLEAPLARHEVRFFLPPAVGALRQAALGPGADCRREAAGVLCTRDEANPLPPMAAPEGAPLPVLRTDETVRGDGLTPLLSFGWHRDDAQAAWSEGPEATLLFELPREAGAKEYLLGLDLDAVARRPGGQRVFTVQVGDGAATPFSLQDGVRSRIEVSLKRSGVVRVVFQVRRPVDPAKRHLDAPVRRAGIRLYGVSLRQAG